MLKLKFLNLSHNNIVAILKIMGFLGLIIWGGGAVAFSTDFNLDKTDYNTRQRLFIDNSLTLSTRDNLILQAHESLELNMGHLNGIIYDMVDSGVADFNLIKLIRILYKTDDYNDIILPAIEQYPLWLTEDEEIRVYWSENHMIMWMSSEWLLHEKFGWDIDDELYPRLIKYLEMKIDYGYYEFFSATYFPYTLSALLNLADYSSDSDIKSLATKAIDRLLGDVLLMVNDKGVFFPASGRSKISQYDKAYGSNYNKVIYLLTGFGEEAESPSSASVFLATSDYSPDEIINKWQLQPNIDEQFYFGHPLSDFNTLYSNMSRDDRVMFQWSSGGYFHPDVAVDTQWLIEKYNLWNHEHFKDFAGLAGFPSWFASFGAKVLASITRSSVLTGVNIDVYKHGSTVLSSVDNYWKGRLGYQQWPWVATTGTLAVWTQSGKPVDWDIRSGQPVNTHLPWVTQTSNVALISYQPNRDLDWFGFSDQEVSLYWPEQDFDQVEYYDHWILGREEDAYIAVRRHCMDVINDIIACEDTRQAWIAVVGNKETHQSFNEFINTVKEGVIEQSYKWNWRTASFVYKVSVSIDGKTIEHQW